MPQLYSGFIVQIDIEDDAESLIEIITFLQRLCGLKQNAIEAVLAQQPLHPLERARIIVDDKNGFSLCQDRRPSFRPAASSADRVQATDQTKRLCQQCR